MSLFIWNFAKRIWNIAAHDDDARSKSIFNGFGQLQGKGGEKQKYV